MLREEDVRSVRVTKLAKELTGKPVAYRTWRTVKKKVDGEVVEDRIEHVYAGRVAFVDEDGIANVTVSAVLSDDEKSWIRLEKTTSLRAKADALHILKERR